MSPGLWLMARVQVSRWCLPSVQWMGDLNKYLHSNLICYGLYIMQYNHRPHLALISPTPPPHFAPLCRLTLPPSPRTPTLQAIRCTAQLRHSGPCMALIDKALGEARSVNEPLLAAHLLHIRAGLLSGRGEAASALNAYQVQIVVSPVIWGGCQGMRRNSARHSPFHPH